MPAVLKTVRTLWLLIFALLLFVAGLPEARAVMVQNRVWENSAPPPQASPRFESQAAQTQRENCPPYDGIASGQEVWTHFDPEGLANDDKSDPRTDPDGFTWSDRDHHLVPRQVARDAGWSKEAKAVFNEATIETKDGHNFLKHNIYNAEVSAEMAEFLEKNGGLEGKTAKQQVALAQEFVDQIMKSDNAYIKGFNKAAAEGTEAVRTWFTDEGSKIVLKSTGEFAEKKGAKILTGIAKVVRIGGKEIPGGGLLIGGVIVGIADLVQGKDQDQTTKDVLLSVTNIDIAKDLLENNPITQTGKDAIESHNAPIEQMLQYMDSKSSGQY